MVDALTLLNEIRGIRRKLDEVEKSLIQLLAEKEEAEVIIEKKVREALLKALIELTPYVSDEEQKEIEMIVGDPKDYDESEFEAENGQ